jgi:hypothetical protein
MHNTYLVPGIVDADVARKQAFERARDTRFPEPTIIHNHRSTESCTDGSDCKIIEPGYKMRSFEEERIPLDD